MTVGVIGLGKVGNGIGKNLIEQGFETVGFDLSEEACDAAAEEGIEIAEDSAEVAERASVVILSLPHPDASRAAVDAIIQHGRPGTDIFDTSTLSALTARELGEMAEEAGMYYFDSPITGGEVGAQAGELTIMIGGDPDRIEAQQDILSAIARNVYHIGDVGDGQFVKLIHNHVGQTTLVIFIEGVFLADKFGVDPSTLYRTLRHWTQIYDDKLDSFFSNEFDEQFDEHFALDDTEGIYRNKFHLDVAHKDLVELKDLADKYETYLPLGNFVEQFHREGMNAGYGDRPHPDLLQFYSEVFDRDIQSTEESRSKSRGRLI
ncbi:NAD(P)-dependent oxidoreductase [Halegenticoccus tardaugens]|uniref:NAD(P)-dependent oxidoreductase n=1 Tax=Halegenticoccus tardaugens TaxID=2071624 RepID=UPI0013E976A8|nr:NAD(P)-dependent oxidoreductase [Halegenticoccus tardaugens]